LKDRDGRDPSVRDYIEADPRLRRSRPGFEMLDLLLPAFRDSDRSHLTVAFGCTGRQTPLGRHDGKAGLSPCGDRMAGV
jgi:UPF0042 nucleotide-binding protein